MASPTICASCRFTRETWGSGTVAVPAQRRLPGLGREGEREQRGDHWKEYPNSRFQAGNHAETYASPPEPSENTVAAAPPPSWK